MGNFSTIKGHFTLDLKNGQYAVRQKIRGKIVLGRRNCICIQCGGAHKVVKLVNSAELFALFAASEKLVGALE